MRTSTTGNCNRAWGFTLIEVLVTLALLALLSTLALPKIGLFLRGDALQRGARAGMALLQETAGRAREEQRAWVLRYDATQHALLAEPAKSQAGAQKRVRRVLLPAGLRAVRIRTRTAGDRGTPRLFISARGYVQPALLTLEDAGGAMLTLAPSPFLGRVRLLPGAVDVHRADLFR